MDGVMGADDAHYTGEILGLSPSAVDIGMDKNRDSEQSKSQNEEMDAADHIIKQMQRFASTKYLAKE